MTGPSKITQIDNSMELGTSSCGFASRSNAYYASTDASLFSTSLPVIRHEKFNLNDTENCGDFGDIVSSGVSNLKRDFVENDLHQVVESRAIGNLLPDDEDELLAGIADGYELNQMSSQDELEDFDLFGSVGGMELDINIQESLNMGMSKVALSDGVAGDGIAHQGLLNGTVNVAGEHPYGEHPSRTLFVRNINSNVEDSELRALFEQYGDIRTLYTACKHRGFVMISYYDIRDARIAMRALQNKPLKRRKLDIHFSIPKDNPSDKDLNQGTLVVFNLDPSVSNDDLSQIFGAYGEVKEIRETPHKRHHKFIEFYDVRAAEAALRALNRSDIAGKRIKLEPSRPGGTRRNLLQLNQELEPDESRYFRRQVGSPITHSLPGSWMPLNNLMGSKSSHAICSSPVFGTTSSMVGTHWSGLGSHHHSQALGGQMRSVFQESHSLPEPKFSQFSGNPSSFGAPSSNIFGMEALSRPRCLRGSPHFYSDAWPPLSMGSSYTSDARNHGLLYPGRNGLFPDSSQHYRHHHHHVGSCPSSVPLNRHLGFFHSSPETALNPIGHNNGRVSVHENQTMSLPRLGPLFLGNSLCQAAAGSIGLEGFTDPGQNHRIENLTTQMMVIKQQFQLNLDKILSGEDMRTTLMIKNIPNKYTSKMLLAAIDENNKGTYDFLYLPIDFKNKCNVGYAFINMLSPSHVIPFYQVFNGRSWEKFNSEKVASLAYARIQGKGALVTHFQNSSLLNEDKLCHPILFHPESCEAGDRIVHGPFHSCSLVVHAQQPENSEDSAACS